MDQRRANPNWLALVHKDSSFGHFFDARCSPCPACGPPSLFFKRQVLERGFGGPPQPRPPTGLTPLSPPTSSVFRTLKWVRLEVCQRPRLGRAPAHFGAFFSPSPAPRLVRDSPGNRYSFYSAGVGHPPLLGTPRFFFYFRLCGACSPFFPVMGAALLHPPSPVGEAYRLVQASSFLQQHLATTPQNGCLWTSTSRTIFRVLLLLTLILEH